MSARDVVRAVLLAGALAASFAGCAVRERPSATPRFRADAVHDLATLADLAARFDADRAHPRLVLLLSPT
jgi:hypothetical protein